MRVKSIHLKNFKRFTDLLVTNIPETAKVVIVVGPNGCGKSSLFDAFIQWNRHWVGFGINSDAQYYRKHDETAFDFAGSVAVTLHGDARPAKGSLYIRTAYRNDPDFNVDGINRPQNPADGVRVQRAIDNDQTVSDNYRRLVYDTMSGVYSEANNSKTVQVLREELIGEIRESMKRVFGDLILDNIADPLGIGTFSFEKGTAKGYRYKNLSGGEKSAFDLLLDLHIKKRFYGDAIYCIDELETHLHTRIQGLLLKEIVRVLPNGCQLWITTHSLGVLRAAQEILIRNPTSACLIDFDGVDADAPRELMPSNLGKVTWEKLMSIALDDLSPRLAPETVVVCEGSSVGNRRKDFDADVYARILGTHEPNIVFVSGGASNQVHGSGITVRDAFVRIVPTSKVVPLIDRDDKSAQEVTALEAQGTVVLGERNIESYLLADDVIEALATREGKLDQLPAALQIKATAIANAVVRGKPTDDLKSAAGDIYVGLKQLFALQRCGNSTDAFLRDTMAPLISPGMATHNALKLAILDRLPR